MSFTQRIKDLTYQTPVTDYLKLRDEINADLNAVSQEDLNEFNDKFFTKYDMMKSKEWEKHEQEKKLSKYVYRSDK